jgi:hypothetical protein
MTQIEAYLEYFQQIARQHYLIRHSATEKHFFMMDITEVLNNLKSGIRYPAMILNSLSGNIFDKKEDNILDVINAGFLVLDISKNIEDYSREMQIMHSTKQICMDIIARLKFDQENCVELSELAIPGFDPDRVKYQSIGPVFDNCFGWHFTFPVLDHLDLEYDPDKWIDPL